ncbi:hypothetical protein KHQ81_15785 (plasmid) [Mycoplasmatota bacterium]|nr:hypothetical protein KHQ81_15785 [Mycoplasmatota bacterium]
MEDIKTILKNFKETEFDTVIEEENIYSKGYAKNPQIINRDRRLPIEAKVLYSLFKLYSNNTSDNRNYFPKVENIIKMLKIGYKRYYDKGLHPLLKYNYITIKMNYNNGTRSNNTYIIMSKPNFELDKDLIDYLEEDELNQNILVHGKYGLTPRKVMLDDNLSIVAKAIYLYLSSFAGNDGFCFPNKELMMNELDLKKARFDDHLKLLKINNYIETAQMRNGKYNGGNVYYIVENPNPKNYTEKKRFVYIRDTKQNKNTLIKIKKSKHEDIETSPVNQDKEINQKTNYLFYIQKFYNQSLSSDEQRIKLEGRFNPIFKQYVDELKYLDHKNINFNELSEILNVIIDFFLRTIIDKNGDIVTYPIKGYDTQIEFIQDTIYKCFDLNILKAIQENLSRYKKSTKNTEGFLITTIYTACKSTYNANKFRDNFDNEQLKQLKEVLDHKNHN